MTSKKDLEIRKYYAQGKDKASYYFDKILLTLSVWWFIFSLKFSYLSGPNEILSMNLKTSWICFLISIICVTISYYFSEKSYEKTFLEYENDWDKSVCEICKEKTSSSLKCYNIIIEILKILSLLSFSIGLIFLLLHYWK